MLHWSSAVSEEPCACLGRGLMIRMDANIKTIFIFLIERILKCNSSVHSFSLQRVHRGSEVKWSTVQVMSGVRRGDPVTPLQRPFYDLTSVGLNWHVRTSRWHHYTLNRQTNKNTQAQKVDKLQCYSSSPKRLCSSEGNICSLSSTPRLLWLTDCTPTIHLSSNRGKIGARKSLCMRSNAF